MRLFIVAAAAAVTRWPLAAPRLHPHLLPPPAPVGRASGTGALRAGQAAADCEQERWKPRVAGPGYDASVDYVAGVLRKAGWKVSTLFDVEGDRVFATAPLDKTGDSDQVVMAGAHLDSVPDGPGMNDNGSGSAALLELAVRMGGSPR